MFKRIKNKIRERLLTIKVKDLYNTIDKDDILKKVGTQYMCQGKPVTNEKMKSLISEAKVFQKSHLWKVLQDDIRYKANQTMFEKSQSIEDMTAGKLWLYTMDCISSRLEELIKNDR